MGAPKTTSLDTWIRAPSGYQYERDHWPWWAIRTQSSDHPSSSFAVPQSCWEPCQTSTPLEACCHCSHLAFLVFFISLSYFYLFNLYCIFSIITQYPYDTSHQQSPPCCPRPYVLLTVCSLTPPPHLSHTSCHPSLHLWVHPHFPC